MPLFAPVPTNGGPANPEKDGYWKTYWEVPVGTNGDLLRDSVFEVQHHKYDSWAGAFGMMIANWRGRTTEHEGRQYPDPYRIIIHLCEPWYCVATAPDLSSAEQLLADLTARITNIVVTEDHLHDSFTADLRQGSLPQVHQKVLELHLASLLKEPTVGKLLHSLEEEMTAVLELPSVAAAVGRYIAIAGASSADPSRRLVLPVIQSHIRSLVLHLDAESDVAAAKEAIQKLKELNQEVAMQLTTITDEQAAVLKWRASNSAKPQHDVAAAAATADAGDGSSSSSSSSSSSISPPAGAAKPPPLPPAGGPKRQPSSKLVIVKHDPQDQHRPSPVKRDVNADLMAALQEAMRKRRESIDGSSDD